MPIERVSAPAGGLNTAASPDYVQPDQAPTLQNLLPGRPGQVVMRGPLAVPTDTVSLAMLPDATTFWTYDDKLMVSSYDWPGVEYTTITGAAGTAFTTMGTTYCPCSNTYARVGSLVYGSLQKTSDSSMVFGKWDPSANTVTAYANGPKGGNVTYAAHLQRVFALIPKGGTLPGGGGTASGTTLTWSDPITGPSSDTNAVWQDDVSGLVNQIVVDTTSDEPIGLAQCGRWLAIFLQRSVYVLTGIGSSDFSVRRVASDYRTSSDVGIVSYNDGCYFMSDRGLCYFDGTDIAIVSSAINGSLLPMQYGNPVYVDVLNRGLIALCVSGLAMWIYDTETHTWSELTSRWFTAPWALARTLTFPLVIDHLSHRVWCADRIAFSSYNETSFYGYDWSTLGSNEPRSVPAVWKSKPVKLASPGQMATISRAFVDLTFEGTAVHSIQGWTFSIQDLSGNVLASRTATTSLTPTAETRSRYELDCYAEAESVQLVVEWDWQPAVSDTTFSHIARAAIYDGWVEFAAGPNRGTVT